ncbi:hypothetical protein ACFX2F_005983 [Malus domestica]
MGEAVLLLVKESNGSLKKWKPCSGMLRSTAKVDVEEEDKGLFLLTSLSDLYENLVKLYCMESYKNWKEDLRETAGSDPVPEARVHSATVQGRVVASLWRKTLSMPSRKRSVGNFVWLDGLLLETGALTSFQVADNKEGEKKLLEETRMCRDPV